MTEISPVKTPSRSIIKPLEPGSITPSAIEELSSQIDSLIQRGRKLRELKYSMSRSPPKKSFHETQATAFDICGAPNDISADGSPFDDILAMMNASDPLFIEEARIPPTATSVLEERKMAFTIPMPVIRPSPDKPCSFSVVDSKVRDPKLSLRLRTKTEVSSERVSGNSGSDIAVEAWRGSDLVGIGRKPANQIVEIPCQLKVDVWDVWTGSLLGNMTLGVEEPQVIGIKEGPSAYSETITLEPSLQPARSSIQSIDTYSQTQNLEEYLVKRNVYQPPAPPPPPPRVRVSTETFVSFLSESPFTRRDEAEIDLEVSSESEDEGNTTFSKTRMIEEEAIAHVETELSTADDLKSILHKKILELDFITNRLTGDCGETGIEPVPQEISTGGVPGVVVSKRKSGKTRRRPRRVFSFPKKNPAKAEPIEEESTPIVAQEEEEEDVKPLEDVGELYHCSSISILPPEQEEPQSLSIVQTSLISLYSGEPLSSRPMVQPPARPQLSDQGVVRLSSKRKESIEKARRTISSLRKSFLKDADRMCRELSNPNSSQDE
jgi:hypothetical protein